MKIAIVGAGYAGLAVAWHLVKKSVDVTVFDPAGIGGGATFASTGLLHPFPGKWARRVFRADEGMAASLSLIDEVEQVTGKKVALQTGVLRVGKRGMWIPNGVTVFSSLYVKGLGECCNRASFVKKKIENLAELDGFDAIVIAAGAAVLDFPECRDLPLKGTLGQSILCRSTSQLHVGLLDEGCHICPTEEPGYCLVGSTYERTDVANPAIALELVEKVADFYPAAKDFHVVEIRSGVRVSPSYGYRPLVQQINPKTWVFSGLGSKGLLYHALFARELVHLMTNT